MSVYLQNKVLKDNLQDVYIALLNGDEEVSEASYDRQSIKFIEPEDGQTSNEEDVFFPIAEEPWGNITHLAIYDNETNGNELFKTRADFAKHIDVSAQYRIPRNYLIVRVKR